MLHQSLLEAHKRIYNTFLVQRTGLKIVGKDLLLNMMGSALEGVNC